MPWLLSNFLNSVAIPNEIQVSEDSKLTFVYERHYEPFLCLGPGYFTGNASFHFHPFPSKFHFSQLHITPLYKYATFSLSIY